MFKKWFVNLELALVAGTFIAMIGLIFAPFYMDVAFLIAPVTSWAQVLTVAGVVASPVLASVVVYTIHFYFKEVRTK